MESDEGSIQFAFESVEDSQEVMGWMRRFILDGDSEAKTEDVESLQCPSNCKYFYFYAATHLSS